MKDTAQLLKRLRAQHFRIRRTGAGHWRATSPTTGRAVTFAATPSSGRRSLANTRAALRRIGAQL